MQCAKSVCGITHKYVSLAFLLSVPYTGLNGQNTWPYDRIADAQNHCALVCIPINEHEHSHG